MDELRIMLWIINSCCGWESVNASLVWYHVERYHVLDLMCRGVMWPGIMWRCIWFDLCCLLEVDLRSRTNESDFSGCRTCIKSEILERVKSKVGDLETRIMGLNCMDRIWNG